MDISVLLERFTAIYGHTDFSQTQYILDEYAYKAERAQEMREWLASNALRELNEQGNWAEVCQRVVRSVAMSSGPLARWDEYQWVGELNEIEQQQFALAFETFLHGEKPFSQRLDTFVAQATSVYLNFREREPAHQKRYKAKKLSWPFVSYFHFMLWPDQEYVFVKPRPLTKAAKLANFELHYQSNPNSSTYARVQEFYRALWLTVQSLGGRDWIDVQTFIHVAGGGFGEPKPKKPVEAPSATAPGQIHIVKDAEQPQSATGYFSAATFDLLQALHAEPQRAFYLEHKEAFKAHLEKPFQRLLRDVAARLPVAITALMETERNVFARILKNDFGQGGTWDFYWGAFYPQGGKRIADPQLSMWINHELLEFGFYIGDYGNASRQRFQHNSQVHYEALIELLEPQLSHPNLIYGPHEDIVIAEDGTVSTKSGMTWADWLRDPERGGFDASVVLPRAEVLRYDAEELVAEVVATYQRLFPLILLAVEDDPLPAILDYLELPMTPEVEDAVPLQPDYPLAACAEETGFAEAELARWVRAIERKGQAILYGPPGTGKTYVAEHLARHLIGGGDGFCDLVQFHPAYAYEDFIQGLRPQARKDGGLDYLLVPGRFLEFCAQAAQRTGRCVLIIDEINRANLARVFGELMYLLEYRDREIPLAGGKRFRIPRNVRLIGTMNTADRSIALVDHALRRRFAFLPLYPDYDVLRRYHQLTGFPVGGLIGKLQELNQHIGDFHYQVGITFFLRADLAETLSDIWQMEIEPYLEEYFFDQPGNVDKFRWANVNKNGQLLP